MEQKDYAGITWDLEFSPKKDGTDFTKIGYVFDFSPDNSSDELSRDYLGGENFKLKKSFSNSATFRTSKTVIDNIKTALAAYILESGEEIEGLEGATAGTNGVVSLGRPVKTNPVGILRLVPKNTAQVEGTVWYINAALEFEDYTLDDNLLELTVRVNSSAAYKGEITFGA